MPKPTDDLRSDCIDSKTQGIDWTERNDPDDPRWVAFSFEECEKCGARIPLNEGGGGDLHKDLDDTDCTGHVPFFEGPMMSYWYPLGEHVDHNGDEAHKLKGPLCLVKVGDQWGLALTGGGMDLTWEICEAFIQMGYLPPVEHCDLPAMAGKDPNTPRNRRILRACRRSLVVNMRRLRNKMRRLSDVKEQLETDQI